VAAVRDQIHAKMNDLTPGEAAFAEYVLKDENIIYKSITVLTEESGIGYGTIIRFCQKVGFSGFHDFKIHLALEKGSNDTVKNSESKGWVLDEQERAAGQLATTTSALDERVLHEVAACLAASRSVLLVAVAGSFPAALELAYRLTRIGITARAESDTHMQAIHASLLGKSDALFAVSNSGSTKEILEAAKLARTAGAKIVTLTNYGRSPLAEISDYVITLGVWEQALEAEIGTRLPFYFVIELLGTLTRRLAPNAQLNIQVTSDSVSSRQL